MKFISGFAGAKMTDDGFVKAQMGWAVAEDKPEEKKEPAPKKKKAAKKPEEKEQVKTVVRDKNYFNPDLESYK